VSQNDYQFDDLIKLQEIIRAVAETNLAIYYTCSTADYKADGSIVTEADLAMQTGLTNALKQHYPGVHMLGEEISEQQQIDVMQSGQDFWCLDPVDGTTNFHATVPLFSVSLGLVSDGQVIVAVIYDPNRDEFFSAIKGQGIWIDGKRVIRPEQPAALGRSIAFVDFKRLSEKLAVSLVQESPYKSQRNIGTCALEWAWLAAGRANLLIHGSERLWDYAAGILLIEEAGGRCETFDAEPIFNQSLHPRSVIAATTPQLFELWASRIRSVVQP
jgi:myo-inositol-1(or 4)-monophosphatase